MSIVHYEKHWQCVVFMESQATQHCLTRPCPLPHLSRVSTANLFYAPFGKCMLPNRLPVYRRSICKLHMVWDLIGKQHGAPCKLCTVMKGNTAFKASNFPCSHAEILNKNCMCAGLFDARTIQQIAVNEVLTCRNLGLHTSSCVPFRTGAVLSLDLRRALWEIIKPVESSCHTFGHLIIQALCLFGHCP